MHKIEDAVTEGGMSQEEGSAAVKELMDHAEKAEDGEEPVE